MEPAKSKPMSILSDLDPKNVRFLDQPSSGRRSKATWFLALIPLLGAAWMFFSFRSATTAASEKSAVTAPAIKQDHGPTERRAALPGADSAPLSAPMEAASPIPEKPTGGAALILAAAPPKNYGQSERTSDGNAFQAIQRELEQPASKVSRQAPGHPASKTSKPKKAQGKVKSAARGSAKKTGQASAASRAPRNTGSQVERDIDIITAIVR